MSFPVLVNVVLWVGQAKDVLAANVFLKGIGIKLVRRMATWVFDVQCGAVGAGMKNRFFESCRKRTIQRPCRWRGAIMRIAVFMYSIAG